MNEGRFNGKADNFCIMDKTVKGSLASFNWAINFRLVEVSILQDYKMHVD